MDKYKRFVKITKKHNLCLLKREIIEQEFQKNIDFNVLFEPLPIKFNFTIQTHVNEYIIENIKQIYNDNYFFQYSIFILSDFFYEDKNQFIFFLNNIYECLKTADLSKLDNIINYLKRNNKFTPNCDDNKLTKTFCINANNFFSNHKIVKFIANCYNKSDLLGNLEYDNYLYGQSYETNFLKALILMRGIIDVDDILNKINSPDDILLYCLEKIKENLKVKIESEKNKTKLLEYLNEVYIKNGYFFHGTTSRAISYIKKHGLTSQYNDRSKEYILKTNKIFEQHNINRMFEGKAKELTSFNFYVTDDPFSAIYYANQSPEFLSRFCANGTNMINDMFYDKNAFWRRDFNACKKNINVFMKKNSFSEKEITIVNKNFCKIWKLNVKRKQYPILFVGKRKNINRNFSIKYEFLKKNIKKYSFKEIFDYILTPDNIHDRQLSKIDCHYLSIIKLPNLYKFYKIKQNPNVKKFILFNNKKLFPDIIISSPFQKKLYFKLTDEKEIIKHRNLIFIPKNINLLNKKINEDFYPQNIDILLSDSAKGLTLDGIKIISQLQIKYSIENLTNFYASQTIQMLKKGIKDASELLCLVDNYYIKYVAIKLYKNYYVNISPDKIDVEHFKVDEYNYVYKYKQTKLIEEKNIKKIISYIEKEMHKI